MALSLIVGVARDWFTIEGAKDLAVTVFTPLLAVTGTALGFYFGGNKDN